MLKFDTLIFLCLIFISKWVFAAQFTASLSQEQLYKLVSNIEQRETAGKDKYLTYWSKNEDFPSFGIGHFIWLPKNSTQTFKQTFPELVKYLSVKSKPPVWLAELLPFELPWQNKQQFDTDFNKTKLTQLRQWLIITKQLQAEFIYQRFIKELNLSKKTLSKEELVILEFHLAQLIKEPAGLLAIIDYANFKGIGNNSREVYKDGENNIGWGLINAILLMDNDKDYPPLVNFIEKAKFVLKRRTELAPEYKNEARWLKGWFSRIDSYRE